MLPKRSRLTAAEVRAILKEGRSAREGALSVKYRPGTERKAAVVISAKVAGSAAARNRLRRSTYDALRPILPGGVHAVFFLHKPAVDLAQLASLCLKLS